MLKLLRSFAAARSTGNQARPNDSRTQVSFADRMLLLDENWVHEREYLDYIRNGTITGPLGMDLWVFGNLVQAGNTVLDAGANLGFTALLAEIAGATEIHSFEPDPRITPRLQHNTQPSIAITIHRQALGARPGKARLQLSKSHNQGSTLSPTHLQLFPHVYEHSTSAGVAVTSVDVEFPEKNFNVLKIDVEGAELALLQGAHTLMSERCPEITYIELYDEYRNDVHDLLNNYYHHCYRIVCRADGWGKLFQLEDSIEITEAGLFLMPPSYIYSNEPLTQHLQAWSAPLRTY